MLATEGLPWPQINLRIDVTQSDSTENALIRCGALSITFLDERDEPVLEPAPGEVKLWDHMLLVALFAQNRSENEIVRSVCEELGVESLPVDAFTLVPDQQWERVWMDQYRAMKFGDRLWICPTHMEPVDAGGINLRLDPGLAFGTGTHATTALCLEWLDATPLDEKSVIDFGCGSGVLAVAALLLGARIVRATDIDPLAMRASQENAVRNGVQSNLKLLSAKELQGCVSDILLANILFQPLKELKDDFVSLIKDRGKIVLSGILEDQVDEIVDYYSDDFEISEVVLKDGWARVYGIRKP